MRGIWTAVITPFTEDNEIDFEAYRKILQNQKKAGVHGVVPCGTTGESPTLSLDEKKKLIQVTLEELKGSDTRVMAGTGSNHTEATVSFSQWASEQGVDAVLVVTPYYNKPSQSGLEAHFRAVADAVNCEVVLYNVPGRTAISLTPETIIRLADHPRITTLKEATASLPFTSEVLSQLEESGHSLDVLSGDDPTFLGLLSIGAVGTISVASNLLPRTLVQIQKLYEAGDVSAAMKLHQKYFTLFRDLFIESNPVPIKAAMAYAGWCKENVRLPLVPLSPGNREKLIQTLQSCGVKPGAQL